MLLLIIISKLCCSHGTSVYFYVVILDVECLNKEKLGEKFDRVLVFGILKWRPGNSYNPCIMFVIHALWYNAWILALKFDRF